MTKAIIVYALMTGIGILAPIILLIIWQKKTKQSIRPALMGAAIFFIFAILLESIPKMILFNTSTSIGKVVMQNVWMYMTIAALLAGIFEETGRLVAFKFLLKKQTSRQTAITYGIGHGGFEVMYLMGLGGIQYLSYSILIQMGQFDKIIASISSSAPEQLEAIKAIPAALASTSFLTLGYSSFERVSAILIHIACSIIMFKAVRCKGKMWMYPLAILLHASIDMIPAMYQVGMITSLAVIELCIFIWALCFFMYCYKKIYKKLPENVDNQ